MKLNIYHRVQFALKLTQLIAAVIALFISLLPFGVQNGNANAEPRVEMLL